MANPSWNPVSSREPAIKPRPSCGLEGEVQQWNLLADPMVLLKAAWSA